MDKLFVRKDVYEEMLEKGFGKRDLSKLTKKQITDKNGHKRTVYVRNGEQPETQKQPKTQELTEEKRARYEEMLEKVKAGPDENALFVRGKGMLNKKDAIAHLSEKLGKTSADTKNVAQRMADAEDKAFAESEKDAQKKYGNMSIEELKAEAKKYDGVSKYSPEANEARKVYDFLNQKLEEEKNTDISQKSSDELQAEQDKIREEYREYSASDDYDEDNEKTEKYVQQLEYYDEQIENAKVRETGMTRYVREGYERIMDAKEERLPEIKADLEQRLANEQQTLERYNKMKPKNKIYKDSLEVNKWAAQRNIDEYLGGLKAINERMGKK